MVRIEDGAAHDCEVALRGGDAGGKTHDQKEKLAHRWTLQKIPLGWGLFIEDGGSCSVGRMPNMAIASSLAELVETFLISSSFDLPAHVGIRRAVGGDINHSVEEGAEWDFFRQPV